MPFKLYQGEINDKNIVQPKGTKTVFIVGTAKDVGFSLDPPSSGSGAAKPAGQTVSHIPIYVNEAGRDVNVTWDGTANTQPPSSNPRTQPSSVATPGPGDWLVTPAFGNIKDFRISGSEIEEDIPKKWQSGTSIKFTTTRCGLDTYIVTYRFAQAGKSQYDHVVVSVRKRLKTHLFEMKKSATSSDTITDFRGPIAEVQSVLSTKFGIDLEFANDKIEPEKITNFQAIRTQSQLTAMLPRLTAPGRDLWINVVNGIRGPEDGWGGHAGVHVEIDKALKAKTAYESWENSWNQAQRTMTKEEWAQRTFPSNPEERKLALQMADGVVTVADIFSLTLLSLLFHETGHALGLVPGDEMGGGIQQTNWRDPSHPDHCGTKTCVMYWESAVGSHGFAAQLTKDDPFTHDKEFFCMIYLFACDLSDIRRYPQ